MKDFLVSDIKRVAAYCRVSTDSLDQANSLESQQRYFNDFIRRNPLWELYEMYVDEGISGTNTKKRKAFNKMISDAREHKFDMIVTKEISRFARNTLDSIGYTRELKNMGIGVYFMNDNINTLDADAELRLTIMSSISQEESRKTSERCKWGQRRMMEQGVVFGRDMLGYDVRNGKLYINEDGAETVRRIFHMYLDEGKGAHVIAKQLREEGVQTSRYMKDWSYTVIMRLLKNEKYCGDLVQQKTYTPDYLSHAKKRNKGELDYVVIKDHHEPIISREVFDAVQAEINRRKNLCKADESCYSNRYAMSGKIWCGECGGKYTHTIRRRGNDKKHYENWSCIHKLRYGSTRKDNSDEKIGCDNVNIQYQDLKAIITHITCDIMRDKHSISDRVISIVNTVLKNGTENSRVSYYEKQLEAIEKKKQKLLDMCLSGDIETNEYKKGFERLNNEYIDIDKKLKDEKDIHALAENQSGIIRSIREHVRGIIVDGQWDEIFYGNLIDRIEVYNDRSLNIHLNLIPKTCCAKVLKGKEINDQNAQKMRAKSALCTYRGSSVPMSVNVAFSSGNGIANRCDR